MSWSASEALRSRREALGLSQAEIATTLGVTKSFLSLVESGKRGLSAAQIEQLALTLAMPSELLAVGLGRLPEDVRGALSSDTASVVAAVRQQMEAEAIKNQTSPAVLPSPSSFSASRSRSLPEQIDVDKGTTSYRTHSYHTKVPPAAIRPFISAYTAPGDTVYDPFCGSGMTGVAALMEGRNGLLSDLSPAAVHIARNYTTPCDPTEFEKSLKAVEIRVAPTMKWLYQPLGSEQIVEYTTWSDVFRCPLCRGEFSYWRAMKEKGVTEGDRLTCPECSKTLRKADLTWIGEQPVQSHTSSGSNRIDTHEPVPSELALIQSALAAPIPYWVPKVPFGSEREMWRASHRAMGVAEVADFFTKRNLHALAALRHSIILETEGRVREALLFAFTAAVNRASKRYQWNAKRPTNVMTGTLYISSLRYEWNVWSLFRRKAADVLRYYRSFPSTNTSVQVFQRSATELSCLPDGCVDMVFMDPPFGSNIFYADASLLWDSWLGELTDQGDEIVVNRSRGIDGGGKSLDSYGALMQGAFEGVARVLKKGGRAVLAFSNSDDAVWGAVQVALNEAGLDTESVHILNKGQPSIKGVKGVTGKEMVTTYDLLLCLKHRPALHTRVSATAPLEAVDEVILRVLQQDGQEMRRTDAVYSAVVRSLLERHLSLAGITMPFVAQRCAELGAVEREGKWYVSAQRTVMDDRKFFEGYLTSSSELPKSNGGPAPERPLGNVRVPGGRSSAFYLAHSYHTKVPPEAITPFIENYTREGDVVLDPFCGSGMTGVAAALAGRRCVLNDLSPAAVHLTWNHTRPCDPANLLEAFARIEEKVKERFSVLYGTTDAEGGPATIHWTLWSTRHVCPMCSHSFLLWDAVDRESGRVGKSLTCPSCRKEIRRQGLPAIASEPAWIAYETEAGERLEKTPDADDVERAQVFRRSDIQEWHPDLPLSADREMYVRCALHLQGVKSLADFYTARNLEALAILWAEIERVTDERLRRALAFAFTNTAWHGTRMRRFNARGGQRPLTGTLYIPQLSSEVNVLEVMRNKIKQLQRYYQLFQPRSTEPPAVTLGSATNLRGVQAESIDYIFTDPPFGSNIFYADCNFIWESWLGQLTNAADEAVVNKSLHARNGGKSLETYAGMMRDAMREMYRVLKRGAWATVVFHNTDALVWQAIHDAAASAGFEFHEASSLDRQQQSHKGYKGRAGNENVAHFDVVFNLRKPAEALTNSADHQDRLDVSRVVAKLAKDPTMVKRGVQGIHAEVMRQLASRGESQYIDYGYIKDLLDAHSSSTLHS